MRATGRRLLPIALAVCSAAAGSPREDPAPAVDRVLGDAQWAEDIAHVLDTLERVHPDPSFRLEPGELRAGADALLDSLGGRSDTEIVLELMRLVARLEDGHTYFVPRGRAGFHRWFPIRLARFDDGLHVVAAEEQREHLVGAQVLRIGGTPADEVFTRVSTIVSADNEWGERQWTPMYLSNAHALHGLGVLATRDVLPLELRLRDGTLQRVSLEAFDAEFDDDWFFEVGGPGERPYATAFSSAPGPLPLHVRHRWPRPTHYAYEPLPADRAMYVQINAVLDGPGESFHDFCERLFEDLDARGDDVERLVLDLRFNAGGNGHLLPPFVRRLAEHERLNRRDRLFVLSGQQTFSAAVVLLAHLRARTNATFVGTPGGAAFNFFSDCHGTTLPHSRLSLWVASRYWEYGEPGDTRGTFDVDHVVPFRARDHFAGEDPALAAILDGSALR